MSKIKASQINALQVFKKRINYQVKQIEQEKYEHEVFVRPDHFSIFECYAFCHDNKIPFNHVRIMRTGGLVADKYINGEITRHEFPNDDKQYISHQNKCWHHGITCEELMECMKDDKDE